MNKKENEEERKRIRKRYILRRKALAFWVNMLLFGGRCHTLFFVVVVL